MPDQEIVEIPVRSPKQSKDALLIASGLDRPSVGGQNQPGTA